MKWHASAPSNIALIKYMGKKENNDNTPLNASLSYTLPSLFSTVTLEVTDQGFDSWKPLDPSIQLTLQAQQRFIKHLYLLKQHFRLQQNFIVCSANNFPADCGLASSASSFAALTLCAAKAAKDLLPDLPEYTSLILAQLSQKGSGSSCRSFFTPWALWQGNTLFTPEIPYSKLIHHVVIISQDRKAISSSHAHQRIISSLLFNGRKQRAETRLKQLLASLQAMDWEKSYYLIWQEFWDMHALFETANPPFGYMQAGSVTVLYRLREYWQRTGDGPLITMDAGANIHLLFRPEQQAIINDIEQTILKDFRML